MAVPFCKMRPELREVLAGAKAEIAALQRAIGFAEGGPVKCTQAEAAPPNEGSLPAWGGRGGFSRQQTEALREGRARADELRALFAAHYEATGVILNVDGIRQMSGVKLERGKRPASAMVFSELRLRLSGNLRSGISEAVYQRALEFFSAIWPEGLAWPISTPRPDPQTQEQS